MGNVRDSALFNGLLIGGALGSFCVGWVCHYFYGLFGTMISSIVNQFAPEEIELLRSTEQLRASGDKALLLCIIIGIVLLAIGIGREAYQRAKRQDS